MLCVRIISLHFLLLFSFVVFCCCCFVVVDDEIIIKYFSGLETFFGSSFFKKFKKKKRQMEERCDRTPENRPMNSNGWYVVFSHLKTKQKRITMKKSIRQSPTSPTPWRTEHALEIREDCPAFAGKTPFQDRVLLNLRALNLPSKLVEESDEKENNTRSVLFAASPPKPTKRKSEEDSVILSLQSQINNIINDLKEEKERSRKLEEECVETLKDD